MFAVPAGYSGVRTTGGAAKFTRKAVSNKLSAVSFQLSAKPFSGRCELELNQAVFAWLKAES
jgi:hypothetical protein